MADVTSMVVLLCLLALAHTGCDAAPSKAASVSKTTKDADLLQKLEEILDKRIGKMTEIIARMDKRIENIDSKVGELEKQVEINGSLEDNDTGADSRSNGRSSKKKFILKRLSGFFNGRKNTKGRDGGRKRGWKPWLRERDSGEDDDEGSNESDEEGSTDEDDRDESEDDRDESEEDSDRGDLPQRRLKSRKRGRRGKTSSEENSSEESKNGSSVKRRFFNMWGKRLGKGKKQGKGQGWQQMESRHYGGWDEQGRGGRGNGHRQRGGWMGIFGG